MAIRISGTGQAASNPETPLEIPRGGLRPVEQGGW